MTSPRNFRLSSTTLLDLLPFGIVLLDTKAKILFANAFASVMLRAGGDLKIEDGFLRARSISHNRLMADAIQNLTSSFGGPVGFSIARTNQRPISVVVSVLRGHRRPAVAANARISVFISDPEANHGVSHSLIRDLFGFTAAESSIAILMIQSMDTAAIARQLDITRNTLRDHLKSMFVKTKTRNQGELLHTLLRCPATLLLDHSIDSTHQKDLVGGKPTAGGSAPSLPSG